MKAVKETIRKYYKYQYQDFVQPVLTSNGTLGGDKFAVADKYGSTTAYKAFDGSITSAWSSAATNTADYLIFYNPKPLLITNIECFNYTWITGKWELYGSNDNFLYEILASGTNTQVSGSFNIDLSSNTKAYKYYRMDSLSIVGVYQRVGWGEIEITAKTQEITVTNDSDYDFYKDIDVYKLSKIDENYYGII